jgi:hypothetical protein
MCSIQENKELSAKTQISTCGYETMGATFKFAKLWFQFEKGSPRSLEQSKHTLGNRKSSVLPMGLYGLVLLFIDRYRSGQKY